MGAIHHNMNSMQCAGGASGRFAGAIGTPNVSLGWATAIDFGKTRIVPPAAETRAP